MPATLLDARQITRRHGDRTVLDAVEVRVDAGSRIGLIGPNGAGKSTLLRIMAGCESPDGGAVRCSGSVGYLPQLADDGDRSLTVRQAILRRVGVEAANREVERWTTALTRGDLGAVGPHATALERWLALGGADIDGRLAAAAAQLGLDDAFLDRPLATLSGGQAARAGLAAVAVARFDVLLLDEPTNHLDVDGLQRLGSLIGERAGGLVIVSHDRALLAEVTDEIDRASTGTPAGRTPLLRGLGRLRARARLCARPGARRAP